MKSNDLVDEILLMLRSIKEDQEKLEKLHEYMLKELYNEEDVADETIKIPEPFAFLVKDTADSLSAGLVCYINPVTLEKIDIPKSIIDTMWWDEEEKQDEEGEEDDLFYADLKRIDKEWEEKITIDPPESRESFSFMEQFVDSLPEGHIKRILSDALSGRKPFRHFNHIIHQSDEREDWFAFRQKCLENYVAEILAHNKLWNKETGN